MAVENFGYKNAWLALRAATEDVVRVVVADAIRAEWGEGIQVAYEWPNNSYGERVFISPPLDGWVLCVGTALHVFSDSHPLRFGGLVRQLATTLDTEVQYFSTHRVSEVHAWARATPAGLARAFSYADGETVTEVGLRTEAEAEVGEFPSEDDVMRVARAWSIDPSALESRFPDAPPGMLGRLIIPLPTPSDSDESTSSSPLPRRPWWKVW
jgi:hypothetical protein